MIDGRVWCGLRFMTRTRRLRASAATMRLAGYHAQRCHWVLELDGTFEPFLATPDFLFWDFALASDVQNKINPLNLAAKNIHGQSCL